MLHIYTDGSQPRLSRDPQPRFPAKSKACFIVSIASYIRATTIFAFTITPNSNYDFLFNMTKYDVVTSS